MCCVQFTLMLWFLLFEIFIAFPPTGNFSAGAQEHVSNVLDSGKAMDRVVFQEIHSGEIFGFDSFLTGAPAYSSIVVDSEKAVVSAARLTF